MQVFAIGESHRLQIVVTEYVVHRYLADPVQQPRYEVLLEPSAVNLPFLRDQLAGDSDTQRMTPESLRLERRELGAVAEPIEDRRAESEILHRIYPEHDDGAYQRVHLGVETVVRAVDKLQDPRHEDRVETDDLVEIHR